MTLTLVIGNQNYSSWSLRPWIAMKVSGIDFEQKVISLTDPNFKSELLRVSGAGKVPVLIDGALCVWESLAILEFLAERFPDAQLWPSEKGSRAYARAIASEMHAGFLPLRRHCPMNIWRAVKKRDLPADVAANVQRIDAMWSDCRSRYGAGGPFLFGRFSAADAMYVPMVSRFHTYAIEVGIEGRRYMEAILSLPACQEWQRAARAEPWNIADYEVDWPEVPRE